MVERAGSILQENESLDVSLRVSSMELRKNLREQTKETFDRFLQAQAEGATNSAEILEPLRLRYFSPGELLRLFGFGAGSRPFTWPAGVTTKSKYRLIGNSVNVHVVADLIDYFFEQ